MTGPGGFYTITLMEPTTTNPIIEKVRKLLAQAAGTSFEAEAQAFASKAQALIEEHQIAEADLRDAGQAVGDVIAREYTVQPPAARASVLLLNTLCSYNAVSLLLTNKGKNGRAVVMLYGTETAIFGVVTTYEALCIQIAREVDRSNYYGENPRAFRNAFVSGFAGRLGRRMEDARKATTAQAASSGSTDRGGLVLMSDARRAAAKFREEHPKTTKARVSTSSGAGRAAGASAADRADFGQRGVGAKRSAIGC